METASVIAIDLAKNVFHLHGATASGAVVFRKTLRPSYSSKSGELAGVPAKAL